MPTPDKSPAFTTIADNDTGSRLAHLQDLIAKAAGERRGGLVTDYHEAIAAGAMHSTDEESVILLTLVTREGESHVFALDRAVAAHLRTELAALRALPTSHAKEPKPFLRKPSGQAL